MEFSRTEYWSGKPFPSPVDLPNPGIGPRSPALQTDSLPAKPQRKPIYRQMFKTALFVIGKKQNQTKCSLTGKWRNCYIQYNGILSSKIKEQSRDIYVCKCQMHFAKWEKSDQKATGTRTDQWEWLTSKDNLWSDETVLIMIVIG